MWAHGSFWLASAMKIPRRPNCGLTARWRCVYGDGKCSRAARRGASGGRREMSETTRRLGRAAGRRAIGRDFERWEGLMGNVRGMRGRSEPDLFLDELMGTIPVRTRVGRVSGGAGQPPVPARAMTLAAPPLVFGEHPA